MLFSLAMAILISRSNFFSIELDKEGSSRLSSLDGLRGFLALGVFFNHSVLMYFYTLTGEWKLPESLFKPFPGDIAVPLFFMITGFLFWSKILESKLNIKRFYIRRLQRIVPLYIFTTLLVVLIVFIASDFIRHVDYFNLITQIIRWFSFAFLGTPDINGFKDTHTIESVYWTLRWEWIFYFLLPILAYFSKKSFLLIIFLIVFSVYFEKIHFLNFVLGILAATILSSSNKNTNILRHSIFQGLATISIILFFFLFPGGFGNLQSSFLFVFFLSIIFGNTIFGLLSTRAARLLGMISYSIYMVHNIIIWIIFKVGNMYVSIETMTPIMFWILVIFISMLVVLISSMTYKYIEHYFYDSNSTLFIRRNTKYVK